MTYFTGSRLRAGLFATLAVAVSAAPAQAQEAPIGFIKTAQADARIVVAGKSVAAEPGMAVQTGYLLKTGAQGSIGLTLRDNTRLSIGPNTEIVVDEYVYAPGKGDLKLWATLTKGTLQYVSGIIAKLKPEAVVMTTPVGIIGVRGTRYVALVQEAAP